MGSERTIAHNFSKSTKSPSKSRRLNTRTPSREELRVLLFQAVRELLMNVVKHAKARWCRITTHRGSGVIQITVEDNGVGFVASAAGDAKGFGLFSIQERIETLGGSILIRSGPGQGTYVFLKSAAM